MTPIAPLVTGFLREHMPVDRGYSPHTCETYAHAFRLLFVFASERLGKRPCQLDLEDIDAALVLGFLAYIEQRRGNGAATRNSRLAAVKAFMRYVEFRVPSALAQVGQIQAIPTKRHDQAFAAPHARRGPGDPRRPGPDDAFRHPGPRDAASLLRVRPAGLGTGGPSAGECVPAPTAEHQRPRKGAAGTVPSALEGNHGRPEDLADGSR